MSQNDSASLHCCFGKHVRSIVRFLISLYSIGFGLEFGTLFQPVLHVAADRGGSSPKLRKGQPADRAHKV